MVGNYEGKIQARRVNKPRSVTMNRIVLILGVLLGMLAHAAMAQEGDGQRIARACSGDFERLCAGRVPLPVIEDFQGGHIINQCL